MGDHSEGCFTAFSSMPLHTLLPQMDDFVDECLRAATERIRRWWSIGSKGRT